MAFFNPKIDLSLNGFLNSFFVTLKFYWPFLSILFVFILGVMFIREKMNTNKISYYNFNNNTLIGFYPYTDCFWEVLINKYDSSFGKPNIKIGGLICPFCGTKTLFKKSFISYLWYCPNCTFKKRSLNHQSIYQKRVENVLERDLRIDDINSRNKLNEYLNFRSKQYFDDLNDKKE